MFSVFEKLKFIIADTVHFRTHQRDHRENNDSRWVRILKRTAKIIALAIAALFALGLYIYYFTPPTITVSESQDKTIRTDEQSYMIKGRVSGNGANNLKINGNNVELVGSDFTYDTSLKEGDNRFIFEASNDRGTTSEIYIIHRSAEATP